MVVTRLSPPANRGNPDEFDYVRYLHRKGICGTAYVPAGHWQVVDREEFRSLRQRAEDYQDEIVSLYRHLGFGGDELAVLSALTVGDKEELDAELRETYSVSGASHVLALSGLHVGLLYWLLRFLSSFLWKRWRWLKGLLVPGIVLSLWGFALLTGLSSSVVRSVTMFSLLALADFQPEKPLTLNTLSATAFLMLLCNPMWLFDIGFQLSFSAVAAIVLLQPKLYDLWQPGNGLLRAGWQLTTVSVAAQMGTAPLVMFYFSRFSTHFLLTNLWVIPWVTLVLYAAVLLLLLTPFPMLQAVFADVVEALISIQNSVLRWIEQLPYASVDTIRIDAWEVAAVYLLVIFAYRACMQLTARRLGIFLLWCLCLVSGHSISRWMDMPRHSILFYNVRNCPAVHCVAEGSRSWVICGDSLADVSRLRHALSPHWNRMGLEEPQWVTTDYDNGLLSGKEQMWCYGGKRICLLGNDQWKGASAAKPLPIDYLYIYGDYRGSITPLSSLFSVGTVVLDASLPTYVQERIIGECLRMGISYFQLSRKGCVRIWL